MRSKQLRPACGALGIEALRNGAVVWINRMTACQERAPERIGTLCGMRDKLRH